MTAAAATADGPVAERSRALMLVRADGAMAPGVAGPRLPAAPPASRIDYARHLEVIAVAGAPAGPAAAPAHEFRSAAGWRRTGREGCVRWCSDGRWTCGEALLEEDDAGLAAVAERVYRDIFAALRAAGTPELLRLWNYVPRINEPEQDLERYRHFNIGRQRAFVAAGGRAFEGAPAACAVGTRRGPLAVHFLAGRDAALAVENPRQLSAYRYPERYGPRAPTFSRAARVALGPAATVLFVSGTASIVGHESRHAGDVRAQVVETVANLRAVLDAAEAADGSRCRFELAALHPVVYLRQREDAAVVLDTLAAQLGSRSGVLERAIVLQADICRAELLFEIEGHVMATPARDRPAR
jgi:enamine deaminase RidA (YjgF/YER057c/UK114 family)